MLRGSVVNARKAPSFRANVAADRNRDKERVKQMSRGMDSPYRPTRTARCGGVLCKAPASSPPCNEAKATRHSAPRAVSLSPKMQGHQ